MEKIIRIVQLPGIKETRPRVRPPLLSLNLTPPCARPVPQSCPVFYVIGLVSITATRSFRPCQNPSDLIVQIDGGSLFPIVDLIRRIHHRLQFKSQISLRILVGARRLDSSKVTIR
ncbi:hypothetical protein F511_31863 [Dorcoceras hygrometricum]|uniref:Uncharacterized protein n=1 Tax=Dorcoceras hygrometricum TaxID=472368 RepID=A0A2Z7A248_9LAMI|nr:hypothetical protein F511_31863 [Dorcoceras hygrometricum]